ncbi:recombinase family protein [Chelatococcus sp. GCM10030263]|uniref:recombinase family protein n=1 Tax=Chelatococcus sp. GCM10030263 TaxID=3273387 RepID=UPI00360EDCA7
MFGNGAISLPLAMSMSLRGLVGQLYREDNAHKVRRGQAGRIGQGLDTGGITYGYAAVSSHPGKRVIVEAEAEIVRRIVRESVAGRTPRHIAHDLSGDRVPPPRGRAWNASTINGNTQRRSGLLQNELYAGLRVVGGVPETYTHLALHYLADADALASPARKKAHETAWRARLSKEPWFKGTYTIFERIGQRQLATT